MTEKETQPNQAADLRRDAEKIARENADPSPENLLALSHEKTRHALHELRVHQIELEMQNSALRRAQLELEASQARYFDLYDLAPVGYVTVSEKGLITQANLTASALLGITRNDLVRRPLSRFILQEDQGIYLRQRKQLLETGEPQVCELRMVKKESPAFRVHLEATVAQDAGSEPVSRVVISDISAEQKLKEANNLLEQMVEERSKQLRQETEARKRPQEPLQEESDTVLLVDDEPHVLSALTRALRNTGYQVLTAGSGSQALAIMETTKIKVIVSDEKMVGMSGSELLAEVWQRFPHTLRILLTGHATLESSMRAVNVGGIYRFLTKPWDDGMLRLALSAATEKYNSDAEKRRLQDIQRQSEERYRTLFSRAVDGIFVMTTDGKLKDVNESFARMHGYSTDEMLNVHLKNLDTSETFEGVPERNRQILAGEVLTFEVKHYHRDGHVFPLEVSASRISVDGETCIQCFHRDITERKRAEILLRSMIDSPQTIIIFALDRNFRYLAFNSNHLQTMKAIWGVDIRPGMNMPDVIGIEDDRMKAQRNFERALSGEHFTLAEEYGDDTLDRRFWEDTYSPIYDENHQIVGLTVYAIDITERREAEKIIRENRDLMELRVAERTRELQDATGRLQLAIQAADVAICELDVVGNLFTWDTTMCRFYGIPSDKLGGTYATWEAAIHPEDRPLVREAFQRALRGEGEFDHEFRIVWSDGSIHSMKANAKIERDSEGRPLRVIGTTLDVTADKLLVEAAEAASRAKSLFIGNMSHELRTPLSGVLGMTEALLNTPLADKQRDYAETIRKSGKALLVVVSDILDFSKISAGNMALESSPFFVETVIANVLNLFGPSAAEEKIGLHSIIHPELPAVRGDAHRLTQVVSNLVGNAIKFTKKGEIQVAVKIMRQTEVEVELAIGVQDTGIGMTEEELSRIFTGFTQGDTTRGRRFGGTGLGLTISRNLVELMGGTLQVESVFGKGSLFTVLVTFPIAAGFARPDLKSLPTNFTSAPINPATPPRPERPPGDMAELQTLLEQMKKPLDNGEPVPCKEILAVLLQKSWPEEQETLLVELNRLVNRYRLQEALDLLNKG